MKRAGLILVVLAIGLPASADEAADLEELRSAIAERRERVAAYEGEEESLFVAVEAVEAAARALRREVDRADKAAREAERQRVAIEQEQLALRARAAKTRAALGRRSVALYKAGGAGPVRLVFSPGTLRDRLGRIQAIQLLLDQDQRLLERHASEQRALEDASVKLGRAIADRDAAQERLAKRQRELGEERKAKESLLSEVRRDRARERALLNELEAAALALEQKLADLESVASIAPDAVPFTTRRGALEAPVPGRVLRGFGRIVDAEYRTETFRKGMDFEVTPGEGVYAVADGFVRFAGWFSGYGRMVIVDHGEGWFTVSGHLESFAVEVDARVRSGDVIGTAGETGSLTGPRLYFEIRQGAEAQDPADWLDRVW
jgi:septal ring factor EnvC (AmiA/AmiB activator)